MLQYVGGILQIVGGIASAVEARRAGIAAMKESVRSAVMARFQAQRKAKDIREEGEYFLADQTTRFAKSGVVLDSGSPALARLDTMRKITTDAIRTEQYGDEAYRQKKKEADVLLTQAQLMAAGQLTSTMGTAMTSYGKYRTQYNPGSSSPSPSNYSSDAQSNMGIVLD